MNTKLSSVIAAASMLALSAITASAQVITGNTQGFFSNPSGPASHVTTTFASNIPPSSGPGVPDAIYGTQAGVFTGDQADPANSQDVTSVVFNGSYPNQQNLNLSSAAKQAIATFTWTNGNTTVPTTATGIDFNFRLTFNGALGSFNLLRTVNIGLDLAGDSFTITNPANGSFIYNGNTINYFFSYDTNLAVIPEAAPGIDASSTNRLYIQFQAVPEPSTYALFGVVALMGLVAVRRFRSSKKVA